MKASDLIQLLMKQDNVDKDIEVVNTFDGDSFRIESVDDLTSLIKLKVHCETTENVLCDHFGGDCTCDCDGCEDCEWRS